MIFVTVGTHEQPFDRLIKEVDRLVAEGVITEEVFIQTGFSTYEPQHCSWKKLLSYYEMDRFIEKASVVITHGGPATFMAVLAKGKKLIVVPRQERFGEHVNNHQIDFLEKLKMNGTSIEYITQIDALGEVIDRIKMRNKQDIVSNTENFVIGLEKIIMTL